MIILFFPILLERHRKIERGIFLMAHFSNASFILRLISQKQIKRHQAKTWSYAFNLDLSWEGQVPEHLGHLVLLPSVHLIGELDLSQALQ